MGNEVLNLLVEHDVLGKPLTFPCDFDLTNPIHPAFDPTRFPDVSPEMIELLRPALQLASRFLDIHEGKEFWVRLALGEFTKDSISGKQYLFFSDNPLDPRHLARTDAILRETAQYVNYGLGNGFPFYLYSHVEGITMKRELSSCIGKYPSFLQPHFRDAWKHTWNVEINSQYRLYLAKYILVAPKDALDYKRSDEDPSEDNASEKDTAEDNTSKDSMSEDRSLRFGPNYNPAELGRVLFQLAILLVHEFAHVVECIRHSFFLDPDAPPLLYHAKSDLFPEMGYMWEKALFSGRFTASGLDDVVPIAGVFQAPWKYVQFDQSTDTVVLRRAEAQRAVPMSWIQRCFQDDFWNLVPVIGWHRAREFEDTLFATVLSAGMQTYHPAGEKIHNLPSQPQRQNLENPSRTYMCGNSFFPVEEEDK